MEYNESRKILFKKTPPVPWTGFWGIIYINALHSESREYHKEDKVGFTYKGSKDYKKLLKYLNMV